MTKHSTFRTYKHWLCLVLFLTTSLPMQAQLTPGAFVTTWRTTISNKTIVIPTNADTNGDGVTDGSDIAYSYTVDWGDGSTDAIEYTGDASHTYVTAGDYQVSITGDFPRIVLAWTNENTKVRSIDQWGDIEWSTMKGAFDGCENMTCLASDAPILLPGASFNDMFARASNFTGDLSHWDVSNVVEMHYAFYEAHAFNSDLSGWNVGNVTNFLEMFHKASSFDSDLGNWDLSKAISIKSLLNKTNLSSSNYTKILSGWASQSLQAGLSLGYVQAAYCSDVQDAKDMLISAPNNWSISDHGSMSCTDILTFSVPGQVGETIIISSSHTVLAEVCDGVDVTNLTPVITYSDPASSPSDGQAINFTDPANITVNSEFGASQDWVISVVTDQSAPVADAASLTTLTGECSVSEPTAPTATDNCSGAITGTHELTFPITRETTIVWTFEDAAGNTSTQNQLIQIEDVTAPVADAASLTTLTGECSVSEPTAPTATDDCSGAITGTHELTFPITRETTIVWTFEDAAGNTSTQNQTIRIEDTTAPVADIDELPHAEDTESVTLTPPTATDACAGEIDGTTDTEFPITTPGITEVEWTYDDGNENTTTQSQYVVIGEIPGNDLCADASAIVLNQEVTGTLFNAFPEEQSTACDPGSIDEESGPPFDIEGSAGVWYSFEGTGNDMTLDIDFSVSIIGATVFEGSCEGELLCLGTNISAPNFTFSTTLGETYLIYVFEFVVEADEDGFAFTLLEVSTNTTCQLAETVALDEPVRGSSIGLGGMGEPGDDPLVLEEPEVPEESEEPEAIWYHFVGTGEAVQFVTSSIEFTTHDMSIYESSCEGDLIENDEDMDGPGGPGGPGDISVVSVKQVVETEEGIDYYIALSPQMFPGAFTFEVRPVIPPANDQCTGAISLSCGDTVTGNTEFSTEDDALAPACGSNSDIGKGVWYSFTGTGEKINLSTCNDDSFDTSISVYAGTCTTGLACVAGNEDGPNCPDYSSELSFISVLNKEYLILVDGYYDMYDDIDEVGEFTLSITCEEAPTPPANDNCSAATALTVFEEGAGTATEGTNEGATAYTGVIECDPYATANDVWYTFNSGYNTTVELTSTFETAGYLFYALYESCDGEAIQCAAGYEDDEDWVPELINDWSMEVEPNTDYLLQVWNTVEAGAFTLILNDEENTAPTITNSQHLDISRYATSEDVLWDFDYDDDEGHEQRFELLSGDADGSDGDNGAIFAIDELTGELYVADPTAFQATDQDYFVMRVKLVDQGPGDFSDVVLFDIEVHDDEKPLLEDVVFAHDEMVAHIPFGFSYTLLGTSPDGDDLIYSIIDGNDYNQFTIDDGNKLVLNEDDPDLAEDQYFLDFEMQEQYVLEIKVEEDTDLALSTVATITININDVNEVPVVDNVTTILNLNAANGTSVGQVRFTDQDEGQTHTFAFDYGNAAGIFAIDASTGEVTVADASALLSAGETNHSFGVEVTDSGDPALSGGEDFVVRVQGTPMITAFAIAEDADADDVVGQVVYDAAADLSYYHSDLDLFDGVEGIPFYIEEDGTIKVGDPDAIDYETQTSHQIFIRATDNDAGGSPFIGLPITINLTNVNERPDFVARTEDIYLSNNAKNGDEVMQVSALDPEGDDLTYTIDDERFAIDESTGIVTIKDVSKIPFFIESMIDLYIVVSDGELEDITEPTVYLVINAAPTLAETSFAMDENLAAGTLIATLSSSDVHGIKSFEITSGNDDGYFALDAGSGALTTSGDSPLDYETTQSHELTVVIKDNGPGNLATTETITLAVNDVNEFAPVLSWSGTAIGEGAAIGTLVGTVTATDLDVFQSVTMSISAGNTGGAFELTADGEIKTAQVLSFATTNTYTLTIDAEDSGSPSKTTQLDVTIAVNDEGVVSGIPVIQTSIYPNPVVDYFRLSGDQPDELVIIDINGRVMLTFGAPQESYDISSVASGVYTMVVRKGKRMGYFKLIKK